MRLRRRAVRAGVYANVADLIPREPFIHWLAEWREEDPEHSINEVSALAGIEDRFLTRSNTPLLSLTLVDAFLVAALQPPTVLNDLYPLEENA